MARTTTSMSVVPIYHLSDSLDVQAARASWLFACGRPAESATASGFVLARDLSHRAALEVHLAAQHELHNAPALFRLGHRLAREHPGPLAWTAIGTYYLTCNQYANARRFFHRATAGARVVPSRADGGGLEGPALDYLYENDGNGNGNDVQGDGNNPGDGPGGGGGGGARPHGAGGTLGVDGESGVGIGMGGGSGGTGARPLATAWAGFGHSFAYCDESDQAVAAYRTLARLMPGLAAPLLWLGMEYTRTGNLDLASSLLASADRLAPRTPAIQHELGVVALRSGQHAQAQAYFEMSLAARPGPTDRGWEPTLVCLGHCQRKARDYQGALASYGQALGIAPEQPGTLAAVGFTLHLAGDAAQAVAYYHRALAIQPDLAFAAEMLPLALQEDAKHGSLPLPR